MSYNSVFFFVFIAIAAAAYFLTPGRLKWAALLAASWVFYLSYGIKPAVFLLISAFSTFAAGLALDKVTAKEKISLKRRKKTIVAVCLLFNFGILFLLKYYNLAAVSLNAVLPIGITVPRLNLLLPLGISFYTFQSAGYVIDVYRGKYCADGNFFKYLLFVSFFPQIIQGPIGRHDRLATQLYEPHEPSATRIKYGIPRAMWGYFKKLVIAERAAVLVNTVFAGYGNYGGSVIFVSVLFYSVLIYCDFSGGIDISLGIAQILGITIDENFKRPFFAVSIADFWRRWHITLGTWLKDYLFYPLTLSKPFAALGKRARKRFGGEMGKLIPVSIATFIVYIAVGLWHGPSLKYIAFGLYNGGIITFSLVMEKRFAKWRERLGLGDGAAWRVFRTLRTLLLVCIGRYFTRAGSFMEAARMLKRTLFYPNPSQLYDGTLLGLGLTRADFALLFLSVLALFLADYVTENGLNIREWLENQKALLNVLVIALAVFAITFFGVYSTGYKAVQFIYQQF